MASTDKSTEWNITTDIYDIVDDVDKLKKQYIPDEDADTLALGIFGYIGDTEAKKIQTSVIMTGELGNEMFPTRAKLMKNVLSHATYNGIEDINAVPARITINMGIKLTDLDKYMNHNSFTLDCTCPIYIGSYEFHFDYDIIITRSTVSETSYSAHYKIGEKNRLSNITQPYLKQPFTIRIGNDIYVIFQALVRQYSIQTTQFNVISESVIQRKSYYFSFDNQLCDFDVYVEKNGKTIRVKPLLYGAVNYQEDYYCWYQYVDDSSIRIVFDGASILPDLNSTVTIKAYTSLGTGGMFKYKSIDKTTEGMFTDISSKNYNYSRISCYLVATTDSIEGRNRRSKKELQNLIPKYALSRGSIITETDLDNYFNLIDTDTYRLVLKKKTDNQLARIWYCFFLLKDELNNIIPTNSIQLELSTVNDSMFKSDDGRYVLPAGTVIEYNPETKLGTVIDETDIPDLFSDEYYKGYYYMTVYNIIINPDPLYCAFYLTVSNKDTFYTFDWVNEDSILQFVANRCNFQRNLLTDQSTYKLTFGIAQAIANDFGLYHEQKVNITDDFNNIIDEKVIVTNNMKCILVFYKNNEPYRWTEAYLTSYNSGSYVSFWEVDLTTDNGLDNANSIKIEELHVAGSNSDMNYGYMEPNTKCKLYILCKFEEGMYGRYDLDDIAPGFTGYTVTNVYDINDGVDFYENFTNVIDNKVTAMDEAMNIYHVTGVPCVGFHYMTGEENANYLVDALTERKAYIDYCLNLLENNMNIDFKFFNTYGPSVMYYIGDKEKTSIGSVDLTMKIRALVTNVTDTYAEQDLRNAIKTYIENLNHIGEFHAPNMISSLMEEFSSRFDFIEFMNYNNFRLGVQHITDRHLSDPHIVPEFLNIRNLYDDSTDSLVPNIEIEILTE